MSRNSIDIRTETGLGRIRVASRGDSRPSVDPHGLDNKAVAWVVARIARHARRRHRSKTEIDPERRKDGLR